MAKRSQPIDKIMREGGYVPVADAAEAIGVAHVSSVHKHITAGRLRGAQAGQHWYVSVFSLLRLYSPERNPILHQRILDLGVDPVDELSPSAEHEQRAAKAQAKTQVPS